MQFDSILIIFVILGLISGLLGGLLGIGGGMVTVPALYYIFFNSDHSMQIAVSTSLAAAFITSAASTFFQARRRAAKFSILKWMIPALILGCMIGAVTAHFTPNAVLRMVFGVIAIFLGIYFFFPKFPALYIAPAPNRSLSGFALLIGFLSSMLGIGGGAVTFPVLLGYQIPIQNASATASAATLITTCVGSLTYLMIGSQNLSSPHQFGYIELPAFIGISLGALLTSSFGVKLAHTLPIAHIKRVFGISLCLIGITMLVI